MPQQVLSPELELASLQLMLQLRALETEQSLAACEGFRKKLRVALLTAGASSDEETAEEVRALIRRFQKKLAKLDGSAEERREKKRRRAEVAGSRFVELEAGEGGEDDEGEGEGEGEGEEGE